MMTALIIALTTVSGYAPGTVAAETRGGQSGKHKPNVILIMVDDMGAECVECYGAKSYKTPRIDALAAAGLRFDNAFSQPVCGPTRACILSGRYPFRSGVASNHGTEGFSVPWGLAEKPEITFAHLLKQQGYVTACAGKWALCHFDRTPDHMTACGFDKYCMWPKVYRSQLRPRYWNPAHYQDGSFVSKREGVFGPDHECDYLIAFMRNNKDRPFLCYWPMTLVHDPLNAPPGSENSGGLTSTKDRKQRLRALHKLNVEYADCLVGRLTDAVDELGLAERTLIIFTSDNGTHRRITTGVIEPGRVLEDLVDFSDVLPTFAELSGAQVPEDRVTDGRSFAPQLHGQAGNPRQWVYAQNGDKRLVRGKKWSLDESGKLYDMTDRYSPSEVEAGEGGEDAEAARKQLENALHKIAGSE
jgi:arylsulfatase A